MSKGISIIIAAMLLLAVTLGLTAVLYHNVLDVSQGIMENNEELIGDSMSSMNSRAEVDMTGDCKVFLRNTGTNQITKESLTFYINNTPAQWVMDKLYLEEGGVVEINFIGINKGDYELLTIVSGKKLEPIKISCSEDS